MFLSAVLLVFVCWTGLNFLVDPFGVFGQSALEWDDYTQTLNPAVAKIEYISKNFDKYDSYVVGSSSAASYTPDTLNEYLDASFYNMFHYGADSDYDKQIVKYLVENDDVKNIVLVLGINEANTPSNDGVLTDKRHYRLTDESAFSFYSGYLFANYSFAFEKISSKMKDTELPQSFDVFISETGCYDKRLRDVEPIGSLNSYLEKNGAGFPGAGAKTELDYIEQCTKNVSEISQLCKQNGVSLTVILSPVNSNQLDKYTDKTLNDYYLALARVTDYWNFSISPISSDPRYFYDLTHTRNATGDMVIERIFGNGEKYVPENFGVLCKDGSFTDVENLRKACNAEKEYTKTIPILLYHHIADEGPAGTVISKEKFESHLQLLKENGFTTVSFDDLISYVECGTELPEKPVIITFDDGYTSNFEHALPLLEKHQCRASVFVIGSSIGKDTYKDTGNSIIPHFGKTEIEKITESGVLDLHSHTFDMHRSEAYEEKAPVRDTILPFEGENEKDYISAIENDVKLQNEAFSQNEIPASCVLSFPKGKTDPLANVTLRSLGYKVTLTTDSKKVNTIVCGIDQSLVDLGRMNISADTTNEQILEYLNMD